MLAEEGDLFGERRRIGHGLFDWGQGSRQRRAHAAKIEARGAGCAAERLRRGRASARPGARRRAPRLPTTGVDRRSAEARPGRRERPGRSKRPSMTTAPRADQIEAGRHQRQVQRGQAARSLTVPGAPTTAPCPSAKGAPGERRLVATLRDRRRSVECSPILAHDLGNSRPPMNRAEGTRWPSTSTLPRVSRGSSSRTAPRARLEGDEPGAGGDEAERAAGHLGEGRAPRQGRVAVVHAAEHLAARGQAGGAAKSARTRQAPRRPAAGARTARPSRADGEVGVAALVRKPEIGVAAEAGHLAGRARRRGRQAQYCGQGSDAGSASSPDRGAPAKRAARRD